MMRTTAAVRGQPDRMMALLADVLRASTDGDSVDLGWCGTGQ